MSETTVFALIFALLAFVGGTPGALPVGKTCPAGFVAQITQQC
jgi:hypothetical protein